MFSATAYDEVHIAEIAKAAGVSHGLIFQYFGSKQGFYVACLRAGAEELAEVMAPDESLPPAERLRAVMVAHLDYAVTHTVAYRSVISGHHPLGDSSEPAEIVEAARRQGIDAIRRALGVRRISAQARIGLRGWVAFCEAAVIEWLEVGRISRDDLVALCLATLVSTLEAVGLGEHVPR
jgi:AcrR family transcriptional regulator